MKGFTSIAIALLSLILFWGPQGAAQVPTEIKIGGTISMTGPFSDEVGKFGKLAESWADVVNEKGGIFLKEYGKSLPIRFIIYDDKSDGNVSARFYEQLASADRVDLFLGPYSSPISIVSSSVAEKYKTPMVMVEVDEPKIYERGYKWIVGVAKTGEAFASRYMDMIGKDGKIKTLALVVQDIPHPRGMAGGVRAKAKEYELKIVYDEHFPPAVTDFTAAITRIKAADPDLVFVASFPAFAVTFMKQAKELNLNPREFNVGHGAGRAFLQGLGLKDAQYVFGQGFCVEKAPWGDRATFNEILKRTGIRCLDYVWSPLRMYAFDAIKAALERAGTLDKEKVMAALKSIRYETVGGENFFSPTGVGNLHAYPFQIQGDGPKLIWPAELSTGSRIYPSPPWDKRK